FTVLYRQFATQKRDCFYLLVLRKLSRVLGDLPIDEIDDPRLLQQFFGTRVGDAFESRIAREGIHVRYNQGCRKLSSIADDDDLVDEAALPYRVFDRLRSNVFAAARLEQIL